MVIACTFPSAINRMLVESTNCVLCAFLLTKHFVNRLKKLLGSKLSKLHRGAEA